MSDALASEKSSRSKEQQENLEATEELTRKLNVALDKASKASEEDIKKLRYQLEQEQHQHALDLHAKETAEERIAKLQEVCCL